MSKKIVIIIVVTAVVALAIFKFTGKKEEGSSYSEITVKTGNIALTVETNGTVKPRNRLEIKPPIAGRIDSIKVREGENIKKGDIVAWMSSSERAALLDSAREKGPEELKKWEERYKPTPVVAPLNGFIIRRNTEPGQTVSSQEPILVMADKLIIKAQVDETDMGKLKTGQKALINLDAYPENNIPGIIEHIAYESQIINNITIYEVDIKPLEGDALLRSGMNADIKIIIREKEGVALLPVYAVNKTRQGSVVMVRSGDGPPEPKKIKIGIDSGELVEILSGLESGDTVLVGSDYAGNSRFRNFGGLPGMN